MEKIIKKSLLGIVVIISIFAIGYVYYNFSPQDLVFQRAKHQAEMIKVGTDKDSIIVRMGEPDHYDHEDKLVYLYASNTNKEYHTIIFLLDKNIKLRKIEIN